MHLPVLATFLSIIALAAGQSGRNPRCFITNDWGSIVPGKPHVLIWDSGSFWDVLLNSGVHSQAEIAGVIARNITQNSIVWIPPKDITKGDPNRVFAVQLWDLAKGTGCVSPAFRFAEGDSDGAEKPASLPAGPVVTTAASLLNFGSITVTAAVATFQSDKAATDQTATGSITGTDTVIPTNSSAPQDNGSSSGPNVLAVAIGTILGFLVVSLIVLSILLWRSRRKRTRQRAESNADTKSITTPAVSRPQSVVRPNSRYTNAAEVTGDSSRFEMEAEDIPQELPPEDMAPVELPADEVPPPRYPGEGTVLSVSALGEVRRSSIDKMFVVSPASDRSSQP